MHNLPYNGRKPQVWSDAMKQVVRFAAVFVAALSLCATAMADPYRVKDLVVDKVAPSRAEAETQGRADARLVGAARLIERLTLPEDRTAARSPIETAAIARLYRSYQTQGEQKSTAVSGGVRATGLVTWLFRADAVREYLEQRGVPYVDTQAALALIIPVATGGVDVSTWGSHWVERGPSGEVVGRADDSVLTPYTASTQGWPRRPSAAEIQSEVASRGADHAVVAEAFQQGAQYYVRLVDLRPNLPKPDIGVAGPFVSLQSAQTGAIVELERAWKVASIVRSTGSTSLALVASFRDLQEWVRIRKGLEDSRLINNLNIEALTTAGADISFSYAGRPDQLVSDLRSRGVDLANAGGSWQLRATATP
jgi:hypothetical protein